MYTVHDCGQNRKTDLCLIDLLSYKYGTVIVHTHRMHVARNEPNIIINRNPEKLKILKNPQLQVDHFEWGWLQLTHRNWAVHWSPLHA